jgi:nucleoside-diphosphate-sugar epimerase
MKIEGVRVLVTSGAGFIGSHVVESLVKREQKLLFMIILAAVLWKT